MVSISKNRRNIKINAFHKKENWFSQVEMDTKPNKMLSYRYQNGFHQQELMKKGENDLFQIKKWFPLVRKQNDFHYVERWFPLVGLDEKQKKYPQIEKWFQQARQMKK